jgi:hypothetical protein
MLRTSTFLVGMSTETAWLSNSATPELLQLLSSAFFLLFPLLVLGEDLPHPVPVIDFAMPSEVDAPIDPDLNEIAVFDDYSWRAFIALNWPAKTGVRGLPDELKKIGDASDPGAKVVWGTWKADYELSEREGSLPTEWSSFDGFTPSRELPFEGSGRTMVLGSFFDFRDFNQAGNGRFGSPLVAQNHTYIRFEVRLNEVEFDFIRDQQLGRACQGPAMPSFVSPIIPSR